jgi:phosphoserine aminotransferase
VDHWFQLCSVIRIWQIVDRCTSESFYCPDFCTKINLSVHFSTPPTFTIYLCSLVLRSLLATPPLPLATPSSAPLSPLSEFADRKSSLIYNVIDSDDFYIGTAQKSSRSRMNATFRLKGEGKDRDELEKRFISEASKRGIKGVAGHRSVGGTVFSFSYRDLSED